ncbi:MAG: hopanoid biosynthesis-associated protein HpnK [Anaerolineae bacterium]|nr:hopanoid biosynthesis-associated protein HpnK [Anaerolineae bacterium]
MDVRPPQVIVTADDFGRSPAINAAVIRAHREGILTGASLMVAGDAWDEAVELARATPTLAVGLHLVVSGARAVLSPDRLPHLVDADGRFPDDPLRLGLRYAYSRAAQQELAEEITAQFERFAATGLPLSHVDGHQHLHVHPFVFRLLVSLARQYGAHGVRVPADDLLLALRHDRRGAAAKVGWALGLGLVGRWCRRQAQANGLAVADRVYGIFQSGRMTEDYVVKVLREMKAPTAELYFHPSREALGDALGPNPGDLATLLSPAVRQVIAERGLRLTTYAGLKIPS